MSQSALVSCVQDDAAAPPRAQLTFDFFGRLFRKNNYFCGDPSREQKLPYRDALGWFARNHGIEQSNERIKYVSKNLCIFPF